METVQRILSEADKELSQMEGLEFSKGLYSYPFPEDTQLTDTEIDIESHKGQWQGAIDFILPLGTPILAARQGWVEKVVHHHDKFGDSEEFAPYLNYVIIRHGDNEFTLYGHLAKDSARVEENTLVYEGMPLGATGKSGWMDKPHLHFVVCRVLDDKGKFKGVSPRFK